MEKAIRLLGLANKYLCASAIAVAILVVFTNTMMRYAFSSGIIMGEELVRYLFVWATFLGVIAVYYDHNHIAVTTVIERLSPRSAAIFGFVMNFGALYALGRLLQGSIMYFNETTNMGQVTGFPYKAIVAAVVVASASCLCLVLADFVKLFRVIRGAGPAATEPQPK